MEITPHVLCPQLSQWRSMSICKPLASISVKFLGQEIAFANIDKAMIEQAVAV